MSEQSKKNCGMARDLMPLSIDGICGENSQQFLDEHMQTCEECRNAYEKMKHTSAIKEKTDLDADSTVEDRALAKSVKKTAKRMKRRRWLIILMVPVLLLGILLTAYMIDRYRMSIETPLPMNTYDISLQKSGRYVALDLNIYNPPGGYMNTEFTYNIVTLDTPDGLSRAAIITLTPTYCPNRDWYYKQGHIATFSLNGSYTDQFCAVDGILYTVNNAVYEYENPADRNSDYTLHVTLGMPVMEICVTDGQGVKTLYTWGDEIPELAEDSAHHFGQWNKGKSNLPYVTTDQSSINAINDAVLWNTEVLITPEERALFPLTDTAQIARENVMSNHEIVLISTIDSTPMPFVTMEPEIPRVGENEAPTYIPEPTQTPAPEDAE